MTPAHTRATESERGTAMLEMALVLPFLLLLLFGVAELGLGLSRAQAVANAAREGARQASLYRGNCNAGEVESRARNAVRDTARRLGIEPGKLSITFNDTCVSDQNVRVRVQYPHEIRTLSALSSLAGSGGLGPTLPLTSEAQMLNEM